MDAGGEQRVDLRSGRQRVRVDDLRLAAPQRLDVAHQPHRVAHAGSDVRAAAAGRRQPLDLARGEVEDVDDGARHVEQLAQRLNHRRGDGLGRLLGRDGAVDLVQDAQVLACFSCDSASRP